MRDEERLRESPPLWVSLWASPWTSLLAIALIAMSASHAQARGGGGSESETIAITAFSSSYTNLKLGTNPNDTTVDQIAPTIDVELAWRVHSVFSFTFSWCHFGEPDPNNPSVLPDKADGFGLGVKVDLPGFFFIGDSQGGGGSQHSKRHPVNTYLFGEVLKFFMTDINSGTKVSTTAARDGFGMDIFPFNQHVYIATRFGLFNLLGVTYFTYAWGLGASF